MWRGMLVAVGLPLALTATEPALAARAEVVRTEVGAERSRQVSSTIRYYASPGERNAVTLSDTSGGVEIRDEGATIEPGPGCSVVDANTVRCEHIQEQAVNPVARMVEVALGDQDDAFRTAGRVVSPSVEGGDGADLLEGAGRLNGGPGDDLLRGSSLNGGPGRDRLHGTDGTDLMNGGDPDTAPEPDVMEGGGGIDTVSYEGRAQPVTVDLTATAAGADGEGDSISGFENIRGGAGSDVLRGDDGSNDIEGEGVRVTARAGDQIDARGGADDITGTDGDDQIEGGPGDDEIWGVAGADDLSGGAGDDDFDLMLDDRGPERISCGPGEDEVDEPHVTHVIPADCEEISFFDMRIAHLGRDRSGREIFRIEQIPSPNAFSSACARIRLGDAAGSFGSRLFRVPPRGAKKVGVPLTPRGRRKARPGALVQVRVNPYLDCGRGRPRGRNGFGAFSFVV